jgi:putative salt-induced outer membrane protein YdiY
MRMALGVVVLAALGSLLPRTARAQDDVLVLRNGDRVTGTLVSVVAGTWTFRHAGGDLELPADQVAEFTSGAAIGVRLADGTIAAGRLTSDRGTLRFTAADGTSRTITPADVAAVGSPDDLAALRPVAIGFLSPFGKFWAAGIGAGFANKSGNSRSRGFNGDLSVERATAKDRLAFAVGGATQWSSNPANPDSALVKTVEKFYGSGRLDVFVSSTVFLFAGTQQEIDKFQGLDLRSSYGAGAGYQIIASDPTDLRFDLSAGVRVEDFTPAAGDTTASVPIASAGAQLRQQLGPMAFDWNLRWTPAVEDVEDYRLLSSAGLSTSLFKGVGFRIGSRNEFNNKPPAGIDKHDWLLTFNLTYSIGG